MKEDSEDRREEWRGGGRGRGRNGGEKGVTCPEVLLRQPSSCLAQMVVIENVSYDLVLPSSERSVQLKNR